MVTFAGVVGETATSRTCLLSASSPKSTWTGGGRRRQGNIRVVPHAFVAGPDLGHDAGQSDVLAGRMQAIDEQHFIELDRLTLRDRDPERKRRCVFCADHPAQQRLGRSAGCRFIVVQVGWCAFG